MRSVCFVLLILIVSNISGQTSFDTVKYKKTGSVDLHLYVKYPSQLETDSMYPAIVFFHGGGWKGGTINQFKPHAEYFASRGAICVLAEYRVEKRHGTTPFESLKDAKSAMRYLKQNGVEFNIDTARIVASGGSAGGHLAAACAMIKGYNESSDNLTFNTTPYALVLFNPVVDNGPAGYGNERIGESYTFFSPLHNIRKGVPSTLFLLGTNDNLIPVETARYYKKALERVGSRCDLILYDGAKHGFYIKNRSEEYFKQTVNEADKFLISVGILQERE